MEKVKTRTYVIKSLTLIGEIISGMPECREKRAMLRVWRREVKPILLAGPVLDAIPGVVSYHSETNIAPRV
jgi:hypothetical protein